MGRTAMTALAAAVLLGPCLAAGSASAKPVGATGSPWVRFHTSDGVGLRVWRSGEAHLLWVTEKVQHHRLQAHHHQRWFMLRAGSFTTLKHRVAAAHFSTLKSHYRTPPRHPRLCAAHFKITVDGRTVHVRWLDNAVPHSLSRVIDYLDVITEFPHKHAARTARGGGVGC